MRYYLTTSEAPLKAPKFYKVFTEILLKNNPELEKKLNVLKKQMDTWNKQGAENRIIEQIDWKGEHTRLGGIRDKLIKFRGWISKHWNDEFYAPQRVVKEIERITGKTLKPTENPATMMEYSKSKAGLIGRTFVMDKAIDEYANPIGRGLLEILEPINPKDMKQFIAYGASKRALDLEKRGIEHGFDIDDVKYFVDKYGNEKWDSVLDGITEWSGHLLDWVVRAGGLGKQEAKLIKELNPVYMPFKRAFIDDLLVVQGGAGGMVDRGQAIKAIKGSGRPIINPIESLISQATELIAKAQKIKIASMWADLAEEKGIGGFITRVPTPTGVKQIRLENIKDFEDIIRDLGLLEEGEITDLDLGKVATVFFQNTQYSGKDNIVSIWRKGKREFYELHPDLYSSLTGLDQYQLPGVMRVLGSFARLLRLGATGLKVSFGLAKNPFRDAFTYAVFSKRKGATVLDPVAGLYKELTAKEGDVIWRFKKGGGSLSGQMGYDRSATMSTYDDMLTERLGKKGKVLKIAKHPLATLRDLLSVTEMAPRSIEVEKSYEKYLKDNPDWSEEDAYVAAFNDAGDVTINFTKSGITAKKVNEVAAFFNVAIRGPEKTYRSFKERPIQTTVKGIAFITMLTLYQWYRNKDEDWYNNLPPAYKYNNLFFEITDNTIVRLPIPFDLGIMFASVPMAAMDIIRTKDPKHAAAIFKQLKQQIPDPT
ncbi:MAG TPA: hypothetical protein ENH82_17000, partial [bacterium]|nr:hypothetical protein [bacterium]